MPFYLYMFNSTICLLHHSRNPFDSSLHIPEEGQVPLGFTPVKIPVVQILGMMGKHNFPADTEIEDKPLYCHWKTKERRKFVPIGNLCLPGRTLPLPFSAAARQPRRTREGGVADLSDNLTALVNKS